MSVIIINQLIYISLKEIINNDLHFCKKNYKINYLNRVYIYAEKKQKYIYNLELLLIKLNRIFILMHLVVKKKKNILFILNKDVFFKEKYVKLFKETNQFFLQEKWMGGFLTNHTTLIKNIKKKDKAILTPQEKEMLDVHKRPDLVFIFSIDRSVSIIHEANLLNIPVISILSLQECSEDITYPIVINKTKSMYKLLLLLIQKLYLIKP